MSKGLLEKQIREVLATDTKSRNSDIRLTQRSEERRVGKECRL